MIDLNIHRVRKVSKYPQARREKASPYTPTKLSTCPCPVLEILGGRLVRVIKQAAPETKGNGQRDRIKTK